MKGRKYPENNELKKKLTVAVDVLGYDVDPDPSLSSSKKSLLPSNTLALQLS